MPRGDKAISLARYSPDSAAGGEMSWSGGSVLQLCCPYERVYRSCEASLTGEPEP